MLGYVQDKINVLLLLFVLLQASAFPFLEAPFPGHPLMINQGKVRINLHGLEHYLRSQPSTDLALGVRTTMPKSMIAVRQVHTGPGPAEAWDEKHIHVRDGAVDIDGFDSIAKDASVLILMSVPPDTMVVVYGDGPDAIYSDKPYDLMLLRLEAPHSVNPSAPRSSPSSSQRQDK